MRKYKAIVIDGKRLLRCVGMGTAATVTAVILLVGGHTLQGPGGEPVFSPKAMVRSALPAIGAAEGNHQDGIGWLRARLGRALTAVLGFDPASPPDILAAEIPVSRAVNLVWSTRLKPRGDNADTAQEGLVLETAPQPEPPAEAPPQTSLEIPPENQAPIKAIDASPKGSPEIVLGNETSYSVNIQEMLREQPSIDMSGTGPKILVIHTHATEAYAPENSSVYDVTAGDRNLDTEQNVVKAGEALCRVFENKGIEVIHDTALHDYPSFNGSYAHSLAAVEACLVEHPSIQMVLDIHRDSIVYEDGTKAKVLTEINGRPAAQLMLVVGTDEKGLEHPNWRENIKNAILLQNAINQRYPTLMRHINLRQERFNGHTTKASMIIETGSSGNSLSEAVYGLTLAGECIADYLNGLKGGL